MDNVRLEAHKRIGRHYRRRKLKIKLDRKTLIRISCLLLLIMVLPFSLELILLIDIGGIDFAVTFLMVYLGTIYNTIIVKLDTLKREVSSFLHFLAQLYIFKPRVFVSHATASGVVMALTCSVFLACLFWIPTIYVSSSLLT